MQRGIYIQVIGDINRDRFPFLPTQGRRREAVVNAYRRSISPGEIYCFIIDGQVEFRSRQDRSVVTEFFRLERGLLSRSGICD